jgi:VWFA-related protein
MIAGMMHVDEHTHRRFCRWPSFTLLLPMTALALNLPSSAQVFRSAVTVGVLDVIVTDDQGRSVPDLTKSDFEVTDEGERRDIVSVSFVSIPITPPQASPVPASDVFTNGPDLLGRRMFAIVVDDLDTSPLDTMRTRAAVKTIVQALPDGDLIAVVYTGQQAGAQEFTFNKGRVLENLNRFVGRRPLFDDTDNVPLSERDSQPVDIATQFERGQNMSRVLETLQNVATWLSPIEGRRKAVLYVTAGLPSKLARAFADSNADYHRLVTLAMQANVAIYPVDARGLAAPDDTDSSTAGLWALANDTGGIATINTNDIGRAAAVAVRDSSAYYMVGYSLPEAKTGRKAGPRRVRVRALRPGLTVRTRLLSAGAPERPQDRASLAALIASPLAGGRIPVSLHAASFAGAGGKARALVTLEIGGDAIVFSERAGKMATSLQYRIVASDVTGRVVASESKSIEFHVSATRRDQMRDSRTRLVSSLDLLPGTYRLSSPPTSQRTFGRVDTLDAFAEAYAKAPADQVRATVSLSPEQGGLIDERPLTLTREKGIGGVQCYAVRSRVPLTELEPANYRLTIAVQTPDASAEQSVWFVVK